MHDLRQEILELKNLMLKIDAKIDMLVPNNATLSYVVDNTGVSRQTIYSYLKNNFTPIKDYEVRGGKTYLAKHTTIELLVKYNNK